MQSANRERVWYVNIKRVEWKTVPAIAVAELIPGERLVMRTTDGPFPMGTTYTWRPAANDRTRMTLRNRGTPTGFSAWVAPFMAYAMRRANRKDLALGAIRFGWPWLRRPRGLTLAAAVCALALATIGARRYV